MSQTQDFGFASHFEEMAGGKKHSVVKTESTKKRVKSVPRPVSYSGMGIQRVALYRQQACVTTAGGLLTNSYIVLQDVTGVSNWTSLAGMYDSYRVRAIKVTYTPAWLDTVYGGAGNAQNVPICMFMDYDTAGATIAAYGYTQAVSYANKARGESAKTLYKKFKLPIPNAGTVGKPNGWLDTSAAAPTLGAIAVVLASTCNVGSATMGNLVIEYDTEFKGFRA